MCTVLLAWITAKYEYDCGGIFLLTAIIDIISLLIFGMVMGVIFT